ncbi:MAG: isoprenylcysteine carboxylmethyltransferase family protein [Candidatus Thorarchaeota archaeon]
MPLVATGTGEDPVWPFLALRTGIGSSPRDDPAGSISGTSRVNSLVEHPTRSHGIERLIGRCRTGSSGGPNTRIKGVDRLREKLPAYPGRKILVLPLGVTVLSLLSYGLMILLDILPRLIAEIHVLVLLEPLLPILGSLLVACAAMRLISSMWTKREEMKNRLGALAYQHMIPRGISGVGLIATLLFHIFTSVRSLPPVPPVNEWTVHLSRSVLPFLGIPEEIGLLPRLLISGLLLVLGVLTVRSAIITFGVDYMAVMYLYFPEESEVQNHEIYSVIRHPVYLAVMLLAMAGLALRLSVYSAIQFLMIYTLLRLHIRREENELVERFGESYLNYMDRVPALHVRARDLGRYLKFLLVRMNTDRGHQDHDVGLS